MSGNMERDKNERLNARKIEEEEMKRTLAGIGIYEEGITYNQMKEILGFLNESEDTSNVAFNNRNTQKGAQYSDNESETRPDANAPQECTESRPSYAYKTNHAFPTAHSERKAVRYSSSPELPLYEARNPTYRRKSSDSDELAEKQQHEGGTNSATHSTNRFYSLRSGSCAQTGTSERKTGQDKTQDEVVQKLKRWRLNPLDVCIDENDVPLRQPCRPLARERAPFESCKEAITAEQCDQKAHAISQHLKEMALLLHNWHPPADSVFQWGSPIQVGTANGSLDRNPLTDTKTEQIKAECTYRDSYERSSKRKASTLIASLTKESSSEDERGDPYDFIDVKKKKRVQSDSKSGNVEHRATPQRANHERTASNVVARQEHSHNDNNNDVDLEDGRVEYLHTKKTADEKNEQSSPEWTTYPRRVVPPVPKARLSLHRQRRGNATSKPSKTRRVDESKGVDQAKHQKKDNALTEKEIRQAVEEDWNSEQEEETAAAKDVEIRPLNNASIKQETRPRLRKKRPFNDTETVRESPKQEEPDKERRLRVHEEKKKKEELSRIDNRNGSWEHHLLPSDDDEDESEMNRKPDAQSSEQPANVSTSSDNIPCPICNKLFSPDEIENHAAYCEQFEANDEGEGNDAGQLECNVCDNYKTSSGTDYGQHVHDCIERNSKNDKRHESKTVSGDSASTSSFRNYKPISEQKDSEIDYLGQFPSDGKSKLSNSGRKRKR